MTSHNPHTNDAQKTRPASDAFRDGWDRIWKKTTPAVADARETSGSVSHDGSQKAVTERFAATAGPLPDPKNDTHS